MTLADYLDGEIVFTDWMEGNWPAMTGDFNYALVGWTEIQGLKVSWGFMFQNNRLTEVEGPFVSERHTGNYVDVSFDTLPWPSPRTYYWIGGRQ